jgi:pimeloyl-ACP methyl ester carboxylesterase
MQMKLVTRAVAAAAVAGVASFTYQQVCEARDLRRFPPPGRLIAIGGRRLHLVEMGQGSPAAVIIPALAENVLQWLPVAQRVAAETRVCVYDRAEVGWSDPPPHWRRTPDIMAEDLHALLTAAGVAPPYVLVGHSIGGIALLVYRPRRDRPGRPIPAPAMYQLPPAAPQDLEDPQRPAIEPGREIHLHLNVSPGQLAVILRHHSKEKTKGDGARNAQSCPARVDAEPLNPHRVSYLLTRDFSRAAGRKRGDDSRGRRWAVRESSPP